MTFYRALLIALMAAGLSIADTVQEAVAVVAFCYIAWSFSSDPTSEAMKTALREFLNEEKGKRR